MRPGNDQAGFTLVELLVVMLILGLLATLAIPAFLSQRAKAHDTASKALARHGQTAIETYAAGMGGDYAGVTAKYLRQLEPTLQEVPASWLKVNVPQGKNLYRVGVKSKSGNFFYITRAADGSLLYTCTKARVGGCPANGRWG
jgi:prepilin-type N-terminal cleavage/methylation domain-containing protein